ncbi:MAG: LCP family protein [Lachnospiraceae bacterium]
MMLAAITEIFFTRAKNIQYNNRVTTILYAGVDSTGKMESSVQYSDKARADTIALVVMDETNQKMTILSINRDTMTKVRRYTLLNGNDNGLYTTHIGFAYSYGDGVAR